MYMIYKHGWFWDIPWIKLFFSPLLHHFSPQLFPAHHVGNLPKPESPGCRFSSFCPMKLAWMLQVLAWDYGVGGNHLPPRMGRLRSFFFDEFSTKKNPKNGDFRYFWGNTCGNKFTSFWARFSFCLALAKVTFRVRWIRWGVKSIDEIVYCKVMDQAFCDCKHQQDWTLLLVAQQTSWAGCLRRL